LTAKSTITVLALLGTLISTNGLDFDPIKIKGETTFSKNANDSMKTNLHIEYRLPLYESKRGRWSLHIGGKISPDYDHFGKEIKVNTFTTIGIDF
jgi:hypothetical protein